MGIKQIHEKISKQNSNSLEENLEDIVEDLYTQAQVELKKNQEEGNEPFEVVNYE